MNQSFRALLVPLLLATSVAVGASAQAAATPTVTILSPVDGGTSPSTNPVVSGKAKGATLVHVTVDTDANHNDYQTGVTSRGTWTTVLNELPAGPATVCAEVSTSAGVVMARDCNTFEVVPDPERLVISLPEEGSLVQDSVWVVAECVVNTTVRLQLDGGEATDLPCEFSGVDKTYGGLTEGSHTVTATMLYRGAVVSTRTRTFTADPRDPGTVDLVSPEDASSGYVGPLTVTGTVTPAGTGVLVLDNGTPVYSTSSDDNGAWAVSLDDLTVGDHRICAQVLAPFGGPVEDEDCIQYTVSIDPGLLSIDTPLDGQITNTFVTVQGSCANDTTLRLSMDGGDPVEQPCSGFYQQDFDGLADGDHVVTASMLHDGQVVGSQDRAFTVDATPPTAPEIISPSTTKTVTSDHLDLVGTGEPGSQVELVAPEPFLYRYVTVDANGTWRLNLDRDFLSQAGILTGQRTKLLLEVSATDDLGNRSATTSYTYVVRAR